MAGSEYDRKSFWSDLLVATDELLRSWLKSFEVISFTERRKQGAAPGGSRHQWHIYSVVARKRI